MKEDAALGEYRTAIWQSDLVGKSRKQRESGPFEYYYPTPLAERTLSLTEETVHSLVEAEHELALLDASGVFERNTEGIARLLLRAEAVSSSYIEGLTVGARRLLAAELAVDEPELVRGDKTSVAVLGNIRAVEQALALALGDDAVTVDTLTGIHRKLCEGTNIEAFGGVIRNEQNWIGGNPWNPFQARFVPPAPEHVYALLKDLVEFCNRSDIPAVLQAAVVHAQFETIHPFADGNGRCGRALIQFILSRRGITAHTVPPVSLILSTFSKQYIHCLTEYRFDEKETTDNGVSGLNEWVSFFSSCCIDACSEAFRYEEIVHELQDDWRQRLGAVRKGSALALIIEALPSAPMFSVNTMSKTINRSFPATNLAIERLLEAGIVKSSKKGKRNRVFEAPDIINEFTLLERRLASPAHDTKIKRPVRPVPDLLPASDSKAAFKAKGDIPLSSKFKRATLSSAMQPRETTPSSTTRSDRERY